MVSFIYKRFRDRHPRSGTRTIFHGIPGKDGVGPAAKKRPSSREGFTIAEAGIAIAVASLLLIAVTASVSEGIRMQLEADRLSLAVTLAQAKMTQLLNNPELSPGDEEGGFDEGFGMYSGYGYKISVTEVNLDLAQVAETGTITPASLDDELPATVQNPDDRDEKMGESTKSETGGVVPVYDIRITISYPRGNGPRGIYEVRTYKDTGKGPS